MKDGYKELPKLTYIGEYIPLFGGRPNREGLKNECINRDDQTNLKIALETSKSLDDFIKRI